MSEQPVARYRVWRNDEEEDNGRLYSGDAIDGPEDAAEAAAEYDHRNRDGWEWSWPVVYVVLDTVNETRWVIEVERYLEPAFEAHDPLPLPMPPSMHVVEYGRPLCTDIRLPNRVGDWPSTQTKIELADLVKAPSWAESRIREVTCTRCSKVAPWRATALLAIGAIDAPPTRES